jgi:hypothetical protein
VSIYIIINILEYLQVCVWSTCIELVNSIQFVLLTLGRTLLILSGYLIVSKAGEAAVADPMVLLGRALLIFSGYRITQ